MGPIDYLILLLIVVTAFEAGRELRRKQWLAAAISIAFFVLLCWVGKGIFIFLWRKVTGP
ncbi:MAG: hypothetical protein KF745_07510 [Phycisphaeraceae bacterium]|nr:hypothetical protein [Phycisphaeraceae bacterium]